MIDSVYFKQAELLLRIIPLIDREAVFALKGRTAINFFARDLPRISVDIDLVYLPVGERDLSLRDISTALVRISRDIESRIPGTKVFFKKIKGTDFLSGLFVQRQETMVKIEPNLVIRGSVYPPERRILSPKAGDNFEISVECQILLEAVTCEDLEKTREELVSMIAGELTIDEKQFIVSIKEGIPRWELIGIEGIENLPAVKWKLLNIGRMNPSKHKKAVRKLRNYLGV
jgi:hypothetical protein